MSRPDAPQDTVVWDETQQAYRWTAVQLPTRSGTGTAATEAAAWECAGAWYDAQPYRVVRRLPRGGIEPSAAG